MLNESPFDPRDRVAIFTFSKSLQLLYVNDLAQDLLRRTTPNVQATGSVVPLEILRIGQELQLTDFSLRSQVQGESIIGHARFALKGFGIPVDPITGVRLIIVLAEEMASAWQPSGANVRLSQRETEVAGLLVNGLTNKEIGRHLALAEQTIKQHVKHIMEKTDTSTRTQLVAKLLTSHNGSRGSAEPRDARV
jgi:DNA-binding CsgD family transcriptional regulator